MSRILIIGATSGIGQALVSLHGLPTRSATHPPFQAELYAGSAACDRVYITGRRQAQLDSISAANAKIEGILFDPNEVSEIPAFAKKMSDKGLDLVVLNAGMQRGLDFSNVSTERLRVRRRTDENLGNSLRALMSISSKRR